MQAILLFIGIIGNINYSPQIELVEQTPCEISIERCVEFYFPEDTKTALAIFKAESGLIANKIGYNCRYGKEVTSCKKEDRDKAVSKDYGVCQINEIHSDNPEQYLDYEKAIKKCREIYDEKGNWTAWSVYKNGVYKKFML